MTRNGFALPLHESPSTHILKPEVKGFPGLVGNEQTIHDLIDTRRRALTQLLIS